MGKIYVIRHGETDYNVQKRYTGSKDIPLNSKGRMQALQMTNSLLDLDIDIIISSTLKRAISTTEIINKSLNKKIIMMDEFVESGIGVYEGLTRDEVQEKYPELWVANSSHQFDSAIHGGESKRQVRERVYKGLDYIRSNFSGKNIILVTHGYISREIYGYFNKVTKEEFNKYVMENCQVKCYDW